MKRTTKVAIATAAVLLGLTACGTSLEEADRQFACTYEATLSDQTAVSDVVTMLLLANGRFMDSSGRGQTEQFFTQKVMTLNKVAEPVLPAGKIIMPKRCDSSNPKPS
jgi:hypothetical protein